MQYLIILSGENVFFETSAGDAPLGEWMIGFLACQLVNTESETLAVAQAKRDLLVKWNQSFNADRKFGMPHLQVERMLRLERARAPKIAEDYCWFQSLEEKHALIESLTTLPKPWFWQKPAEEVDLSLVATRPTSPLIRSLNERLHS